MKAYVMAFVLSLAVGAQAQTGEVAPQAQIKLPVSVNCRVSNNDTVGSRVCTALRDNVAKSPRYRLVEKDSAPTFLDISVVTMLIEENDTRSVMSVAFSFPDHNEDVLLSHEARITGLNRINDTAASIFAEADDMATLMLKAMNSLPKK